MTFNQNAGAAQRSKPPTVAERIVQALREAGYSCELADEAYSGGASCRSSHVRNASLATVGPKMAACRAGPKGDIGPDPRNSTPASR